MTPPPSSQAPHLAPTVNSTPADLRMSPPAPDVDYPTISTVKEMFTTEQIDAAGLDELRDMVRELSTGYREAKTKAASIKLQYTFLEMDFKETKNRMDVELKMSQREVQVLAERMSQNKSNGISTLVTPVSPLTTQRLTPLASPQDMTLQQLTKAREQVRALEREKHELRKDLKNLKQLMLAKEESAGEKLAMLQERIRDNRRHWAEFLRDNGGQLPNGVKLTTFTASFLAPEPQKSNNQPSVFETPKIGGRFTTPHTGGSRANIQKEDEPIAALLLAGQVLSQENSGPSPGTPTPNPRGGARGSDNARPFMPSTPQHKRAAYSLSSLQNTPVQARTAPAASNSSRAYYAPPAEVPKSAAQGGRASRDSTISLSDIDEKSTSSSSDEADEEVFESQASREARSMLAKSASRSFDTSQHANQTSSTRGASDKTSLTGDSKSGGGNAASDLMQRKLYAPITKPGLKRSKATASDGEDSSEGDEPEEYRKSTGKTTGGSKRTPKKAKVDKARVGLGIGGMVGK